MKRNSYSLFLELRKKSNIKAVTLCSFLSFSTRGRQTKTPVLEMKLNVEVILLSHRVLLHRKGRAQSSSIIVIGYFSLITRLAEDDGVCVQSQSLEWEGPPL